MCRVRRFLGSRVEPSGHRGAGPCLPLGASEALPWLSAAGLPVDAADTRAWLCGALITPARGGIVCTGRKHMPSARTPLLSAVRLQQPPLHLRPSFLAPSWAGWLAEAQPPRLESAFVFVSRQWARAVWTELTEAFRLHSAPRR